MKVLMIEYDNVILNMRNFAAAVSCLRALVACMIYVRVEGRLKADVREATCSYLKSESDLFRFPDTVKDLRQSRSYSGLNGKKEREDF